MIRNVVLALSVLTSGSLWLLLTRLVPGATLWFGAIASTLATFLTLYLYTAGINAIREEALELHRNMARFLAVIRGRTDMSDQEFWNTYKDLEHRIMKLRWGRHD